jgi:hypothetical protein
MDVFLKLKILFSVFIGPTFEQWKKEIWDKDLDALYCCGGQECGCYGATIREVYTRK